MVVEEEVVVQRAHTLVKVRKGGGTAGSAGAVVGRGSGVSFGSDLSPDIGQRREERTVWCV